MQDGEVLVARETTPEYMPAILKAVAIVTDRGGVLSHPAIVARELRIPGIVGTGDATKKLAEGTEVVVDGTQGAVFVKHR
jgi:pyruvate,water dikinase